MNILIVGTSKIGGAYKRIFSYKKYLEYINHEVDIITMPENDYYKKSWFLYNSAIGRLRKNSSFLMRKIGEKMDGILSKKKYDVIIGVETKFSQVLTKDLGCLKIFSCQSLEADERYFSKQYSLADIHELRELEKDIMSSSDYVVFPWKSTENYVREYILDGKNFITIKTCCYPQKNKVSYFYPFSIVSLGTIRSYWANRELLSKLTEISPYIIDVYGKYKKKEGDNINHKGFAKSLDVFYDYQFGLNTISKDPFRRKHFSSRIMSYLSYGLPVLFPDWQEYPKDLGGCIPYNEDNFLEVIKIYEDKDEWDKISEESYKQAHELNWKTTMQPLEKIIEK